MNNSPYTQCQQCHSRNLACEDTGEVVCRNCGTVNLDATIDAHSVVSEVLGKAMSASDHMPVDTLKIVEIGSQHDQSSQATIGLCREICDVRAKDYDGHKVKPGYLAAPYVTGQVVGKNSQVVEIPGYNVWYSCGHNEQFEHSYDPDSYCTQRQCMKYPVFNFPLRVPIVKRVIAEVHHYWIPKAKRNFRDDTIYRKTKIRANAIAAKLQMDPIARNYYGTEVNKVFDEFVGLTDILALVALYRLRGNCPGLHMNMPPDILVTYDALVEKLRLFFSEPVQKAELVSA